MASSNALNDLHRTVKRFSNGFTTGQKAVVLIGIAVLVVAGAFFSSVSSSPPYGVLFSNLSAQDAGAITTKLQTAGVPYQLADQGTVIMVPESMVDQERIDMAQAGLPANSTVGLSIMSKVGITTSQITQQADYQQALQGQLAQTIEAISGVRSAQVNLALPPTDVFAVTANQSPSASILVTLSPGVTLSSTQVQAIVHLVASAIPNMSSKDVTVADQNGDVLAAPGMSNTGAVAASGMQAYDATLEASIQSMLATVVGPNNSSVRVSANLNYNQVTTNTQSIQTNKKGAPLTAVTQSQTQTQTYTGNGAVPGGTLGAITPAAGTNQANNYKQNSVNNSYAVGQVNQTVKQSPGGVQRLSVAVLVNSKVKGVSLAKVRSIVSAAAGIVPGRDTLSVQAIPFATQVSTAAVSTGGLGSIMGIAKIALLVIGIIGAILLMARASGKTEVENLYLDDLVPALALDGGASGVTQEFPRALSMPVSHPIIANDVLDYIDQQPEDVAKLLRIWMSARGR
ncbi:MAG: flagellar basal-body MS-ring/collar protein FliF [Ferrimicrobium sp.]